MTTHFDFDEQYRALRDGRACVELADWSSVTLTGRDRQKFLNSFCTNDVKSLEPGTCCETFVLNVKGRILGHGLVSCRENELVFAGMPHQSARLVEHFDRYIIREDVQLRDSTSERKYYFTFTSVAATFDDRARLLPWNLVGQRDGCLLELDSQVIPENAASLAMFEESDGSAAWRAFTAARIEAGMPLFGVDFDEHNFPQEVDRDRDAISFTKGCYLGQETVARIDALGHVNQKIVGVRFVESVLPAASVELTKDGAKVGTVTSASFSPQLSAALAIAMVRREACSTGTRMASSVGDCEVTPFPLRIPSLPGRGLR